ncbi:30S ribosomal protein S6 [Alicyclobacillus tolerans]|uniref:Small ribosomal subunit protein bS6 n=2 Tax=Alicyclobacillus tolerans TaxID=90970 RepID=A0ABT9LUF0_9BACL|nr:MULTISPECIES: 30S ribosomal protein S6 [Alicyclobacillus]MDP9727884.1 small subunit ribosomal protein S6 [Alicyclobacillus tengchongensis]QRF24527.1 30S ribosomal protein S6 [Alicyclobacillus sp. TC]SHK51151.1 SSU ribosomal protein S6P [Alicyclobacillus montanus]
MRQYETMYILKPELESEQISSLVEKYQSLVTEHGGQIDELQEIGKRRLAYEIDRHREGFYVLMKYSSDTDVTNELERVMRIEDNVLRYLTVRLGE